MLTSDALGRPCVGDAPDAAGASTLAAVAVLSAVGLSTTLDERGQVEGPRASDTTTPFGGVALVARDGARPTGSRHRRGASRVAGALQQPREAVIIARPGDGERDPTSWVGKLGAQLSLDARPDLHASALRIEGHPAAVRTSKDGVLTLLVGLS